MQTNNTGQVPNKGKASKPLTTTGIAYRNLLGKAGRTTALVLVVAIMAFALFGGSILSTSLENGLVSLEARLGADIAVVPPGSEAAYESVILAGAPMGFYFDQSVEQAVAAVPGVAEVTRQFYLATLADAECCSIQIQIVGIDYSTDFVVMPWIAHLLQRQIGAGEVIVGSDVNISRDNTVLFFDTEFTAAARLERTATGMDNTVYMNMDTAQALAHTAQSAGLALMGVDVDNAVSAVLLNLHPGYTPEEVAQQIQRDVPDVGTVVSAGIYASLAANLGFFTGMIHTITIVFGVLAVLILAVLFSLIASGRKKEFAVLRILGATRKKLGSIVLTEALGISLCGAVLGSAFAGLVVFPFGRHIGSQMGMPLLLPNLQDTMWLLAFSLVVSIAVGPLAAAYSAFKISRAETYATMREGE